MIFFFQHHILGFCLSYNIHLPKTLSSSSIKNDEKSRAEQAQLEARLGKGLVEFLHTETVYSLKRLLPADIKTAYVGRNRGLVEDVENPFSEEYAAAAHAEKGGMQLHEHVTYNCLAGDFNANVESDWLCPICQVGIFFLLLVVSNFYCSDKYSIFKRVEKLPIHVR